MHRLQNGQVIYQVGDRVKISECDKHKPGTVKYPPDSDKIMVQIDGEKEPRAFHPAAIVKQADAGGIGAIKHLEDF